MSHITCLGLGAMGQRMARRLLDAGHTVTVWNRTPAAAQHLLAAGALWADTPRWAVRRADFVMAMVYDDEASHRVWLDPADGALAALPAGALAIESSTLSPAWVAELGLAMSAAGCRFIDAPVAGSRPQAEAGQLIHMVGGSPSDVAAARPVLAALGGALHHLGPVGSGAWLKLAVNALLGTQVVAIAEQLSLLRHGGLDLKAALDALKAMPVTSPAAAGAAALMLASNHTPQAPVDLIVKDLGFALDAADRPLPLTQTARDRYRASSQAGDGAANLVAVARLYGLA